MDVVAGRKTVGEVQGEIFVNGHPKDQRSWSRTVGYVEQVGGRSWLLLCTSRCGRRAGQASQRRLTWTLQCKALAGAERSGCGSIDSAVPCAAQADIHSPGATVQEALWFSARLRLPQSVSDEQVGLAAAARCQGRAGARRSCRSLQQLPGAHPAAAQLPAATSMLPLARTCRRVSPDLHA
jgi:hypothetical protein